MRRLLATLTTLLVLPLASPAYAGPREDKRDVDRRLAAARDTMEGATRRARTAIASYDRATAALPAARRAAAEARGLVVAAEAAAKQARREADAARRRYRSATLAYQRSQRAVDAARDDVGRLVAEAYKGQSVMRLNAVLAARSPSELADRIGWLDTVARHRRDALDRVTRERLTARQRQNTADAARRRADAADSAARRTLGQARQAQRTADDAVRQVGDLVGVRERARDVAEQERDRSLANYRDLRDQSARIAARIRAASGGQRRGGSGSGSGGTVHDSGAYFRTPVAGAYKSSDYGWRFDPYYHVSQLHAGVDLAVGAGTPIHAGAAGRVVYAGWNGGYGNYTCLLHGTYRGQSLSSCYAHQSSIGVGYGQWVGRGQYIGRVGSTGASTGPHLHFEVRLDGNPVQPLGWLPGCLC